jgi:hypothetical protein
MVGNTTGGMQSVRILQVLHHFFLPTHAMPASTKAFSLSTQLGQAPQGKELDGLTRKGSADRDPKAQRPPDDVGLGFLAEGRMEAHGSDTTGELFETVHELGAAVYFLGVVTVDEARIHVEDPERLGASRRHSEEQHWTCPTFVESV